VGRLIVALILLAIVLVAVSGFLELIGAVRQATLQAQVEAGLVAGNVLRQLDRIGASGGSRAIEDFGSDPGLQNVLLDALVLAPSMLHVAVIAPSGTVVAHTMASRVGEVDPRYPELPRALSFGEAVTVLIELVQSRQAYQREFPMMRGDAPFATIRVVIGGTFLWDAVKAAASRGMMTAIIVIGLAIGSGLLLYRFARGRFRTLEQGITALREGRFDTLPESGIDEFARLAHGLNALGARLSEETKAHGTAAADAGGRGAGLVFLEGQTNALARLGEVAAGIAHEIGNQMQAVELDLDTLQRVVGRDADRSRQLAEAAAKGVASVGGAVRGFLKIARLRPPTPQSIQINDLLTGIAKTFTTEAGLAGVRIDLDLDPEMPRTMADPEVLAQAVQNLIRNALQAMAERGEGRIVLRSACSNEILRIAVKDDGAGIPAEIQEKIFELFFTTRTDGSGVGLPLVRQSIEMHGGRVLIVSGISGGTEVILELPWTRVA
jgi:signal transduction histidine kinase